MKRKIKATQYSEKVNNQLNKIIASLYDEQGEISEANELTLDLLGQNLDLNYKAMEAVKKEGILINGRQGVVRHPGLSIINSTNLFIAKLINNLGLSPTAKSKMKIDIQENNDIEEFVK